jgi:hypothetical protein
MVPPAAGLAAFVRVKHEAERVKFAVMEALPVRVNVVNGEELIEKMPPLPVQPLKE